MMLRAIYSSIFLMLLTLSVHSAEFRFPKYVSLEEMRSYLSQNFEKGDDANKLRNIFIDQGGASYYIHPEHPRVEKYIYDINLCRLYVWRWNISADYDENLKLVSLYLNGEPVPGLSDGTNGIVPVANENEVLVEQILRGSRPRPEADLGENSLGFLINDRDASSNRIDDLVIVGAGPSRADPNNLGRMVAYTNVALWRSIFDFDPASSIAQFSEECPE